jgi:hypothetical protein
VRLEGLGQLKNPMTSSAAKKIAVVVILEGLRAKTN